jgi:DNA-binding LacI/PurR family transcriptional regulator
MRVTIKDIAKKAGVSIATVSYIINNTKPVTPETRDKVLQAIKELNYRPNYSARGLANYRTNLIGVLIPYWDEDTKQGVMFDNPFYSELVRGVEVVTSKHHYHILLMGISDRPQAVTDLVQQRDLDGLIVVGAYQELVASLTKIEIPVVLVDTYAEHSRFYTVQIDDEYGGYLATQYLLTMGHEKIGLLTGELFPQGVAVRRFQGYKKALAERGLEVNHKYVYETKISTQGGYEGIDHLLQQAPDLTALFSMADIMTIGILKRLREAKLKVPDHLSIVSFDGVLYPEFLNPALTTIDQDIFEKGRIAATLLIKLIFGEKITEPHVVLPVTLAARESVKELK